jgi:hypothetical protein
MVQYVKLKAVLQKRQGCRTCGVTLRAAKNQFHERNREKKSFEETMEVHSFLLTMALIRKI